MILSFSANAQKNRDVIALLDTSAFKGKLLLNNAIRFDKFFDPFREKIKKVNANKEIVLDLPAEYFNYLSDILEQADLKQKPLNDKLKNIIGRKGNEVTKNNVIPISIINSEAILLTKEQVVANQEAKKNNKKADSKDYETIEFIAAGLLQSEAFQGNLSFEIDPSIIINNLNNPIKNISIDFNDGKGFKDFDWKQQTISHQFTKVGDQIIKIKLTTNKGIFITNCPIKIHFLARPIPSYIGNVSSPSIRSGRIAANVAGAEYAIFMGCDGILDKPIIIAEGFDAENDLGIDNLVSKYQSNLVILTNNGYDLVFVNYNNGTDFIENNAQALKRVINEINAKKIGSGEINKLSIIGESMSGLVARWALREMENAGQNHQVTRLICFDTPHRGANTSPGLSYLAKSLNSRGVSFGGLIRVMFNAFSPALNAIESPASRQQLLFQTWDMTAHPDYATFRTNLNNLGNGGYPSQCKNIAFINGALDGRFTNRYDNRFNHNVSDPVIPGEKILDTDIVWGVCYDFIDCWTNQVGGNTEVYNEDAFGFLCDWTFSKRSINLPYNLDRLAGGRNSQQSDLWGQFTSTRPNFAFVPAFSAVDYRGTLNIDADYSININEWLDGNRQVRADRQNLTPFRAVYGNNENNLHSYIDNEFIGLSDLAINEFGINPANFFACQGCTAGSGGLAGTYFGNEELGGQFPNTTTTDEVNYHLDNGRPMILGRFTNGSARFEGSVQAPVTGTYTFNMRSDDGCRVWFDGTQRVDDWGYYAAKDHPFQVSLTAGERKNIKIEWKQGGGGYVAEFYWELNGIPAIVPRCYLFPTATGGGGTGGGVAPDRTELGTASDNGASNPGGEGESQAFDNSNFTKWLVFSSTGNIVYDFANDDSYAINRYTITSANDDPARDPKNWNLQGSNDNANWTTVNTQSNQFFGSRFETKTYNISNTTPFKQYRLNVTSNNGSNLLQIAEIQMFGPASGAGCSPPSPPLISTNTTTAPAELSASGCSGTVTWSTGSTSNPLTNVGSGTYTATCTVSGCTSGSSNSIAIVGGGGSCPTYSNPQWFHWDNASSSLWFAHYGPTGKLYAAVDANPATPALTRQQLLNSGVTPTLANCFLDGSKQRIASDLMETDNGFEVFPNPTNGKIKVTFTLQKDENVWFNLYDTLGKNLQLTDFEGKKGRNEIELDLQNYISGAFFIDLQYDQKREVRKVIKVN